MVHTDRFPDKKDRDRTGLLWIVATSWGAALLFLGFMFGEGPFNLPKHVLGHSLDITSASLGVWLWLIVLWWTRQRKKFDPFEFPVWVSLNAYFQVVLNVWLFQRSIKLSSPWLKVNAGTMMTQAVVLIGVGLTALWAGYIWFYQLLQRRPRLTQSAAEAPKLHIIVSVWFVTWLLTTSSVVSGINGYLPAKGGFLWTNYLTFNNYLGNLVTFALMIYHFRHPTGIGRTWLIFSCGSTILLRLIIGTKGAAFMPLYVIMAAYYAGRKFEKKWFVIGLVILLIIVPTVNTFRRNLFDAGFSRSVGAALTERVPILVESAQQVLDQPFLFMVEETRYTFEQRQGSILETTAAMMAVHPAIRPYVGLDMLSLIMQQVIPRLFWPSKTTARPEFYMIYSFYLGHPGETTFVAPGLFGEAYRTGGWLFVIFGFWVLGVFAAWLYHKGPARGNLPGTAFYLMLMTRIIVYDRELMVTIVHLLQFGSLAWLLTMRVMFEPLRRQHSTVQFHLRDEVLNDPI